MKTEAWFKEQVAAGADSQGGKAFAVTGHQTQEYGMPDLLVMLPRIKLRGRVHAEVAFWLELKIRDAEPRPVQNLRARELWRAGARVFFAQYRDDGWVWVYAYDGMGPKWVQCYAANGATELFMSGFWLRHVAASKTTNQMILLPDTFCPDIT